jgi:hypothetical protein
MIEVELPDGRVVEVDTTDANVAAQAAQKFLSAKALEPSMLEDAAKSVGSGLGRATIGAIGGLGDLREAASQGVSALGNRLGVDLSPLKTAASAASNVIPGLGLLRNAPTSRDVRSTVTDPIVSPDYQPQSIAGSYLKTAAEFTPGLLTGGRGNLGANILRNVVAPAAVSETAGQLTQGTAAEPYARVAGALAGAGGASAAIGKFQDMAAARSARSAIPSGEALLETGGGQFNQARNMDVAVKPNFIQKTAADMRTALKDFDAEDANVKDVFRKIDRLEGMTQNAASVAMNEVENVRKQLSKLRMSPDGSTREAAKRAQEVLTKNQMGLTASDAVSGDASLYSKTIRDAVGNYGAGKRSAIITGKQNLAELNAGTAGSGGNDDNALRQALKQLARPINNTNVPVAKKLGFNEAETTAIRQGAMGTPVGNAARYLGKLAPTGSVSGAMSAGAGYGVGGPVGAVALPAAGYLAKKIGDMSTKSAVKSLDFLVRSRSPLAQQVAAQLPPQIVAQLPPKSQRILQTLALSAPPLRQQIGQPVGQPSPQ